MSWLTHESKDEVPGFAAAASVRKYLGISVTLFVLGTITGCSTLSPQPPVSTSASAPTSATTGPPAASAPVPAAAPQPTGSLWTQGGGTLFQDIKANNIGDIVTITVVEQSTGSKTAATNTARTSDLQGGFKFNGVTVGDAQNPAGALTFGPYQAQFSNQFDGTGATSRTGNMAAYMTATVVEKLPNGNLVIRGSRWTKVNNDLQQIVLEGVIRPTDITRENTVLSQNIAEAKIFLVGKGPLAKQQKPGWLGQIVDFVSPF